MKYTKRRVDYRDGVPAKHCGNCSMFISPDTCTAVEGRIHPAKVCDIWKINRGK